MINSHSFSIEWIMSHKVTNPRQSETIEKVIQAFALLELLTKQDFDFIFKGGSSLLLHFDDFHRFSVDIDIMISPVQFSKFLNFINTFSDDHFFSVSEDKRKPSLLQKFHYKFYYNSVFPSPNPNLPSVLLDVVVDEIPYKKTSEKEIKLMFLEQNLPYAKVRIPSPDEMLGDKLTAFAPNTIGVRYEDLKFTEIIKQLYDCSKLSQVGQDFDQVIQTYSEIGKRELIYRGLTEKTLSDCLEDTLSTCKLILSGGKTGNKKQYEFLTRGITGFSNFVTEKFNIHSAMICAMNIYICAIMIQAGGKNNYLNLLKDFDPKTIKAPFLSKGDVNILRTIAGPQYGSFLEAVCVESKL